MLLKYHLSLEHMPWTQGGPLPSSHSPSQGKLLDFCPSRDQTFAIAKLFFKKNCFWQIGLSEYNTTRAFFPLLFFPPPYLLLAPNTESLNWLKQLISLKKPYSWLPWREVVFFQTKIFSKCSCFLMLALMLLWDLARFSAFRSFHWVICKMGIVIWALSTA